MPRGARRNRKRRSIDSQTKDCDDVDVSVWPPTKPPHASSDGNSWIPAGTCIRSVDELNEVCRSRFRSLNKINSPTQIQRYAWPVLTGKQRSNLISISPTGSGKTFAYGLPLESRALVMTPTRELTQQVAGQLQRLEGLNVFQLHGGRGDKEMQTSVMNDLSAWNVLVATPGRLLDILETRDGLPIAFDTVILDEADRLAVDGSLQDQVNTILSTTRVPTSRIVLVSATHPDRVTKVWKSWVNEAYPTVVVRANTLQMTAQHENEATLARIPPHIQQIVHVCSDHKRRKKLIRTLEGQEGVGIVFFAKIQTLQEVARFVCQQKGSKPIAICHGQLSQDERDCILRQPFQWLFATDLAARGIHCEDVRFVIQFDFASNLQQYVHRCGRIRGTSGKAYAFFSRRFRPLAGDLVSLLESCGQQVDPNLQSLVSGKSHHKKAKKEKVKPAQEISSEGEEEDEFAALSGQRIVLKRDPNVSEPSEGESSGAE